MRTVPVADLTISDRGGRRGRRGVIFVAMAMVSSALVFVVTPATPALAAMIVVNTVLDTQADDGACSLREAILNANGDSQAGSVDCDPGADADEIAFNIEGPGLHTISLASALPQVTDQLTIDGYTQSGASANTFNLGSNAVLNIELSGNGTTNVLDLRGSTGSRVLGLIIGGGEDAGIRAGTDSVIQGNWIGIDSTGLAALTPPNGVGIRVSDADNVLIGGAFAAARNVISGNNNDGVFIDGSSANTIIRNNYIGTDAQGELRIPNLSGICACSLPGEVTIGGDHGSNDGNLISGNQGAGIYIQSPFTTILGNKIGTNADGTAALANSEGGIISDFLATNTTIGNGTEAGRNVISGNTLQPGGANGLEEGGIGLFGNLTSTTIRGNFIGLGDGVDVDPPIPNNRGITIGGSGVTIGGPLPGDANVITANEGDGIQVLSGTGVRILGNSIYDNGGRGINLAGGDTNDLGDADGGPNNLINFPVLASAVEVGVPRISWAVDAAGTYPMTIHFYVADNPVSGEGKRFLGDGPVPSAGNFSKDYDPLWTLVEGDQIVATVTDGDGNTSNFSAPVAASVVQVPQNKLISEVSGITGFGRDIDIDGDWAVIGETSGPSTPGRASVYVRDSAGNWNFSQLLGSDSAGFGLHVAIDGNYVAVSRPGVGNDDTVIYQRANSSEPFTLYNSVPGSGDLDIADGMLLVGNPTGTGSANIANAMAYDITGATPNIQQIFWPHGNGAPSSDPADRASYGEAVAIHYDRATVTGSVAIGAPALGKVFTFDRGSGGAWNANPIAVLTSPDGAMNTQFGNSVAVGPDALIVGEPLNSVPETHAGAAFVYPGSAAAYGAPQKLLASDSGSGSQFGFAVAIDGNVAVVGAMAAEETNVPFRAGAIYAFARSGGTWQQTQLLYAADGAADDGLGFAVGLSGTNALGGAPGDDNTNGVDAGAVYALDAAATAGLSFDLGLETGATAQIAPAGIAANKFDRSAPEALPDSPTIAASSISSIDAKDTSLAAITIDSTPLRAIVLNSTPLRAIPLVDIGVDGGWTVLLAGTPLAEQPLATLTFGEALSEPTVERRIAALPLRAIEVQGTPLRAIPLAAIALGKIPLRAIELPSGGSNINPWCAVIEPLLEPNQTCEQALDTSLTLMEVTLRGVPLRAIPLRAIPLRAILVGDTPLRAIALNSIDLAASPLRAIPLRAIDAVGSPLRAIPLRAIGIESIPLRAIPLRAIPIEAPLRAITTSIAVDAAPLRAIDANGTPLSPIQLEGAPLRAIPLAAITLADVPLAQIKLEGVADVDLAATWCDLLADAGVGFDCTNGASPTSTTLRDLSLNGVPLRAIPLRAIDIANSPLRAIPLRAIDIDTVPLRAIPLRAIDLSTINVGGTPLRAIPLRAIDVANSPLRAIPLRAIDAEGSPLRAIPLRAIPMSAVPLRAIDLSTISVRGTPLRAIPLRAIDVLGSPLRAIPLRAIPFNVGALNCALVDCVNGTLGDAYAAGAFSPDTTLGEIQAATVGIRLGELAPYFTGFTAAELAAAIPVTLTIGSLSSLEDVTLGELGAALSLLAELRIFEIDGALTDLTFADLIGALLDAQGQPLATTFAVLRAAINGLPLTLGDLDRLGDVTLDDLFGTAEDPGPTLTLQDIEPLLGFITLSALQALVSDPCGVGVDCLGNLTLDDLSDDELGHLTLADIAKLTGITIGDLLALLEAGGQLDRFSLADLLLAMVDANSLALGGVPFEKVNVTSLPAGTVETTSFSATFSVTGSDPKPVSIEIALPPTASYVTGTSALGGVPTDEPTIVDNTLSWTIDVPAGSAPRLLTFDVLPGVRLGATTLAGTARIVGTDTIVSASATVTVTEGLEVNDFVPAGRPVTVAGEDVVYLTYIASPTDLDVFQIDVAENDELIVELSNLDADLDIVLWGRPTAASVGAPLAPTSDEAPLFALTDPDAGSAGATPLNDFVRLDELDPTLELVATSNRAGTVSETISTERLPAGRYYVQVYGANGAVSTDPAALQMKIREADAQPVCRAVSPTNAPGATPTAPTIPANTNTLILVNQTRTESYFGTAARTNLNAAIGRLMSYLAANPSLGIAPVVVPVDAFATVRDAYATWDSIGGSCDPEAANAVVAAINGSIINPNRAQFKHIVILGGDQMIPMARLKDSTAIANEYEFRHEFDGDLAGAFADGQNALTSSMWEGRILSDEPYGDAAARSLGDRFLYVTDAALGRVVETPAEIIAALDTFVTFQGTLSIETASVLGYDFLADGSAEVAAGLRANGVTTDDDLADGFDADLTAWDRADAIAELTAAGTRALVSLNAHFDHYRALPAAGDKVPNFDDNLLSADLDAAGLDLSQSLVFSMGCHSGLSVSDVLIGATNDDWAQSFSGERTLFIGNTGFGYGDTESVAYTEELMSLFARQVTKPFQLGTGVTASTSTIGQALAWAKNDYVKGLQSFSVYDEKAVMESTFYGLPFYRVGLTASPLPPAPQITPVDDATGTPSTNIGVTSPNAPVSTPIGSYFANPNGGTEQIIVAPGRPIQPKNVRDISVVSATEPTLLTQVAHGALVQNMQSRYLSNVDPVIATPVFDEAGDQPESDVDDVAFPSKPLEITSSTGPEGERQSLVLATGQYRSDTRVQRLDDVMDVVVYYADPSETDFKPPTIGQVSSEFIGGRLALTVEARDASNVVDRVFVLVAINPGTPGSTWTGVDLVRTGTTNRWTGGLTLPPNTVDVEFIVQAKDAAGNVGFATNKALNFNDDLIAEPASPPPPAAALTVNVPPTPPTGIYTAAVPVNVVTTSTAATYSVDGATPTPIAAGQSFSITGEGLHSWIVSNADGYERGGTVTIDTAAPVVTANPAPGLLGEMTVITLSTLDAGAGGQNLTFSATGAETIPSTTVTGSTATVTLDTDGATTVTATATDGAGNTSAQATFSYTVDTVAPVINVTAPTTVNPTATVTITCTATDASSGVATTNCANSTFPASTLTVGPNILTFFATDMAGNTTTVTRTITLNAAPTVRADMGIAGLEQIGYQTGAVAIVGSFTAPAATGPFTASVRWSATGSFTNLVLNNNTQFIAGNVYSTAGTRVVTVRICDARGACATDDITVHARVTQKVTPVRQCVVNRGAAVNPRYLARWGYNNPASYPIAVPTIPSSENTFTTSPYLRGQPQIFMPGSQRDVFTTTFQSGTQTWKLNGVSVTAATNSPACP
jgi:CSLREA domain-containing protein